MPVAQLAITARNDGTNGRGGSLHRVGDQVVDVLLLRLHALHVIGQAHPWLVRRLVRAGKAQQLKQPVHAALKAVVNSLQYAVHALSHVTNPFISLRL